MSDSSIPLRPDVLEGTVVALATAAAAPGPAGGQPYAGSQPLAEALDGLGAQIAVIEGPAAETAEAAVAAVLGRHARVDTLVVDAAAMFGSAPGDGLGPARSALDGAWIVTRAVAVAALIPQETGGKVVYLAPPPDAGSHAQAARDGLENLARTLSIEWARHRVRVTTVAPGANTAADDLHALVAYLASPAGDYFSGVRLSLGEVAVA